MSRSSRGTDSVGAPHAAPAGRAYPALARNRLGVTLLELLMSVSVLSVVLAALCEVFMLVQTQSQRQIAERDALLAASNACLRVSSYVSRATQVTVLDKSSTADALAVNMPADKPSDVYVPIMSGGLLRYRSGIWIVFYLSDSTGAYSHTGNILWAASFPGWDGFPGCVTPDSSWSLYYGGRGRIAPLESTSYGLDTAGGSPKVTMTASTSLRAGRTRKTVTMQAVTTARNTRY